MAILRNPESPHTKAMAEWEMYPSEWTIGGLRPGRPYQYRPYPKLLYKAQRIPGNGKWSVAMDEPTFHGFTDSNEWERACQYAQRFTASCQRIVGDEAEHKRAKEDGWRDSPKESLEFCDALDKAVGDAAAERNYRDRNMGAKAKAESKEFEAATFGHQPEIPEKPIKRRGRHKKVA